LFRPEAMRVVIPLQVVYKSLWLGTFVAPLLATNRRADVPVAISIVFLAIVLSYPAIYWLAVR
jgi:hypothetical protein